MMFCQQALFGPGPAPEVTVPEVAPFRSCERKRKPRPQTKHFLRKASYDTASGPRTHNLAQAHAKGVQVAAEVALILAEAELEHQDYLARIRDCNKFCGTSLPDHPASLSWEPINRSATREPRKPLKSCLKSLASAKKRVSFHASVDKKFSDAERFDLLENNLRCLLKQAKVVSCAELADCLEKQQSAMPADRHPKMATFQAKALLAVDYIPIQCTFEPNENFGNANCVYCMSFWLATLFSIKTRIDHEMFGRRNV